MDTPEETKNIARRVIASSHVLRDNLRELLIDQSQTPNRAELTKTYAALLLVIYQLESNFIDI